MVHGHASSSAGDDHAAWGAGYRRWSPSRRGGAIPRVRWACGRHRPHPCCHGYRLGLNGPLSTCPGQLGLLLLEKLELEVPVGLKISDPGTRNLAAIPGNVGEGGAAQSSEAR